MFGCRGVMGRAIYRSVKNDRDGHPLAALLDAADSVRFLPELFFALNRRPRPCNRYLEWELARHPLPGWDTGTLPDAARRVTGTGDVLLQRRLFARVEAAVRRAGHGAVPDAWGEDLDLMRPRQEGARGSRAIAPPTGATPPVATAATGPLPVVSPPICGARHQGGPSE